MVRGGHPPTRVADAEDHQTTLQVPGTRPPSPDAGRLAREGRGGEGACGDTDINMECLGRQIDNQARVGKYECTTRGTSTKVGITRHPRQSRGWESLRTNKTSGSLRWRLVAVGDAGHLDGTPYARHKNSLGRPIARVFI